MKVTIEKLVYGGKGLARIDGKALFVPFAVPGDELEVEIIKKGKGFDEGRALEVVKASPHRIDAKCPYYGVCGGCQMQHMDYAAQLMWKQIVVEEQLTRIGKIKDPNVLPVIPSPMTWNYRNRIQVHKRESVVGFCKSESNEIVEIKKCLIANEEINKKLNEIRMNWPAKGDRIEVSVGDIETFSQVNPFTNVELKKTVLDYAKEDKCGSVLELYAGSGNITFPLARICDQVKAVELDEIAVEKARVYALEQDIDNVSFEACGVEQYLKLDKDFHNLVVVDPPREGLGKKIVSKILKKLPDRIVYISCDPSTLARDLQLLLKKYKLEKVQPIDMFPQTYHVETVSLLTRQ